MKRIAGIVACAVIGAAVLAALRRLRGAQPARRRSTSPTPTYARAGSRSPAPVVSNGAIFQADAVPAAVRGPPRAPGRRHASRCRSSRRSSASQKSTSSIDKSGKLAAGVTALPLHLAQLVRPRQRRRQLEQHLRRQGHAPRTATTSPARSPRPSPACCPTATCWSPARSRSASTTTSTCCASRARSTRARSSPATSSPSAQIANVRIEQRGRGAQAEAQGIGWLGALLFERSADLRLTRIGDAIRGRCRPCDRRIDTTA